MNPHYTFTASLPFSEVAKHAINEVVHLEREIITDDGTVIPSGLYRVIGIEHQVARETSVLSKVTFQTTRPDRV